MLPESSVAWQPAPITVARMVSRAGMRGPTALFARPAEQHAEVAVGKRSARPVFHQVGHAAGKAVDRAGRGAGQAVRDEKAQPRLILHGAEAEGLLQNLREQGDGRREVLRRQPVAGA